VLIIFPIVWQWLINYWINIRFSSKQNRRYSYLTISSRSFGLGIDDNWILFVFCWTFISFFNVVGRRDGLFDEKISVRINLLKHYDYTVWTADETAVLGKQV
jgi:hypothetical protein